MYRRRLFIRLLALVLICSLTTTWQWLSGLPAVIVAAETFVQDRLTAWLSSKQPENRIVIIDIDEYSLSRVGPWPWPRAVIADLVENLVSDQRVLTVGLDMVFPAAADEQGDGRLAALGKLAPVVYAQAFDYIERQEPLHTGVPVVLPLETESIGPQTSKILTATGYVANHAGLAQARCVGNIGIRPAEDGQVRRVPLLTRWGRGASPLLPLAMLICNNHTGLTTQNWSERLTRITQPEWRVPYSLRWSAYSVVSAADLLQGQVNPYLLRGRWAFVGASALGLNDRASTPNGESAGVMVHAAVLSSLLDQLDQDNHHWPHAGRFVATVWVLVSMAICGWALARWRAWVLWPIVIIGSMSWLAVAAAMLHAGLTFAAAPILIAYLLVFLLMPFEWWLTQRDQGRLLNTFASYVAPTVLREMIVQGVDQLLKPKYCEITVLSADMQDYTGLTYSSTLQEAAVLTQEFLQCLTDPLLKHGGTLDKYTGDGLVAFWGAPLPVSGHADKAILAAQKMVEQVQLWNEKRVLQGLPVARVRIGIESGTALVGDLGTQFRRTYTAVGACINGASKLQSAAKHSVHDVLVGPTAARLVKSVPLQAVGYMQLAGHIEPVLLHAPVDFVSSVPLTANLQTNQSFAAVK